MIKKIILRYSNRFLSKWVILIFDSFSTLLMFALATVLRFNFDYSKIDPFELQVQMMFVGLVYLFAYLINQSYTGIIRHTSLQDAFRLLKASFSGVLGLVTVSLLYEYMGKESVYSISRSILIIHFLLTVFLLIGSRFIIKNMFQYAIRAQNFNKKRVMIFGAGASGLLAKNALYQDASNSYQVVAFLDDNPHMSQKSLDGIPIFSPDRALSQDFIEKFKPTQIVIAIHDLALDRKKEITERSLELGLKVKAVPPLDNWINGEFSAGQLRQVQIEELLGRDEIKLDIANVKRIITDKTILVTGAAGSIGSEIVRQVLRFSPYKVILLDQAESALYDLDFEIKTGPLARHYNRIECVLANIKDLMRMERVFRVYRPDMVFHAAAYKHVPLMEDNPYEAILGNIFGTKILADLSVEYDVKTFVMVSTDKAVNPTNVMGASKRVAEIYTQALGNEKNQKTQFITTRFGNVLGSNGSVIPIFKKQIENGGPVTITHRDITRYFMTIPEACSLVLEAACMGNGGEIFVFDMGEPVRIYDLARKMIALSGLQLGRDIEIKFTGLRPGEKIFEEVLNQEENTLETHHPKIRRAQVRKYAYGKIGTQLEEISEMILEPDNFDLVRKLKEIVPEYISNNSIYSTLDRKRAT